jgi:hypothetical protein
MSIRQLIIELARTEADADGHADPDLLDRQRALIRELRRRGPGGPRKAHHAADAVPR